MKKKLTWACTVRACGLPLEQAGSAWRCARGHSFDRARRGFFNLLQPQDRRSKNPGDGPEIVEARLRLAAADADAALVAALALEISTFNKPLVLDVGCGEGSILRALAERHELRGGGVDLSAPAIEAAARAASHLDWVIANADRGLPVPDASLDVLLSVTARLLPEEFHRALQPHGRLLVVVAGDDDLFELRELVLGEAPALDKAKNAIALMAGKFRFLRQLSLRSKLAASPAQLKDLLLVSYRAGRDARARRAQALDSMTVTLARELLIFEKRP